LTGIPFGVQKNDSGQAGMTEVCVSRQLMNNGYSNLLNALAKGAGGFGGFKKSPCIPLFEKGEEDRRMRSAHQRNRTSSQCEYQNINLSN
jgi:hypothetical protein